MAFFSYKCKNEHFTVAPFSMGQAPEEISCHSCDWPAQRDRVADYKNQTITLPNYMRAAVRVDSADVLPNAKMYEGPGDSDGSKGFKEWKDTHSRVGFREI